MINVESFNIKRLDNLKGCCVPKFEEIMTNYMPDDIIPPGPFEQLRLSVDKDKAKTWFEQHEGTPIQSFRINMRIDRILRAFIEEGGFEI